MIRIEYCKVGIQFYCCEIKYKVDCRFSAPVEEATAILHPECAVEYCGDESGQRLEFNHSGPLVEIKGIDLFSNLRIHYTEKLEKCLDEAGELLKRGDEGWFFQLLHPEGYDSLTLEIISPYRIFTNAEFIQDGAIYWVHDLRDLAIVVKGKNQLDSIARISIRGIEWEENFQQLFDPIQLNIKDEIRQFIGFYLEKFGDLEPLWLIECVSKQALAISFVDLIVFNGALKKKPLTFLAKYLFHEMIHQQIGLRIRFDGDGSEWLKESFTEYIQLLYLRKRFGEKVYQRNLDYYAQLYFQFHHPEQEIPLSKSYPGMADDLFGSLICGKGLWVFKMLFELSDQPEEKVNLVLKQMQKVNGRIILDDFKQILREVLGGRIESYWKEWLDGLGFPSDQLLRNSSDL